MLTVAVTYVFATDRADEAEAHLRELVAATRREPGCRRYDVFRAAGTPGAYLIFEQYDDEAALDAHRASDHFLRFGKNGIQPMAQKREATIYADFA